MGGRRKGYFLTGLCEVITTLCTKEDVKPAKTVQFRRWNFWHGFRTKGKRNEDMMSGDRYSGVDMGIRFYSGHLSREQREALEQILLEEMEVQIWYGISWSTLLGGEVFLNLQ
jgi:hypothetical protein